MPCRFSKFVFLDGEIRAAHEFFAEDFAVLFN